MGPKFELIMYHHNTLSSSQSSTFSSIHANAIIPSTWFVNFYNFKRPEDTSSPSKLEILILLDSGYSICVLNIPFFTKLADQFLKCSESTPSSNDFKILTVAKKN